MSERLLRSIDAHTKFFFDKERVDRASTRMNVRALSKVGAYVRTAARSLIRPGGKKGRTSKPGEPPRSHVGHLRKFLFFSYVPDTESVVVGPAALNHVGARIVQRSDTIPAMLERGGSFTIDRRRSGKSGQSRIRKASVEARPFMQPAMRKTMPQFAGMFQGEFHE